MDVTDEGMVTDINEVQLLKAPSPIDDTEYVIAEYTTVDGIVIEPEYFLVFDVTLTTLVPVVV